MSILLRLKLTVHLHSIQHNSHLFICLLLGHLGVIIVAVLQSKCLETTTDNTFKIKLTAHSNLEMIAAAIQLITFTS